MLNVILVIVVLLSLGYGYIQSQSSQAATVSSITEEDGPQCYAALYDKAVAGDHAALAELSLRAEKGNPSAQNNLALMYAEGRGVTQDIAQAAIWYRKAAEQGLDVAQNALGVMYGNGKGVPQDYSEARKWFQLAAAQGNADAVRYLQVPVPTQ